jgi:hypothetical protein
MIRKMPVYAGRCLNFLNHLPSASPRTPLRKNSNKMGKVLVQLGFSIRHANLPQGEDFYTRENSVRTVRGRARRRTYP